jgi:alkylhydroperoxidase family enzyme
MIAVAMDKDLLDDAERREALVLGDGPRIGPLEMDTVTQELSPIIERMIEVNSTLQSRERGALSALMSGHSSGAAAAEIAAQVAALPEVVRTMVRHPELFARQLDVGLFLLSQGALERRDRELAILRIGWLCQAPYEWGEHVIVAKKLGIASEEIERITLGSQAPGWSEHERAILRATEELHADAMISDETWTSLLKTLDEKQLIELPILIGQYQTVAYYQNSLRLRLQGGNLGLKAR